MRSFLRNAREGLALLALAWLAPAACPSARADIVLSDNLSNENVGTEAATAGSPLAAAFTTDSSSYTLTSVTLLLQESVPGTAVVDIYNDGGLQPGSLVGTLTSPASYSTDNVAATTFTSNGVFLSSDSTYWVVLAASGEFDWGFTDVNTGNGAGFQDLWASYDSTFMGWFPFDYDPLQMTVTVAGSAVPEPASMLLLGMGAAGALGYRLRRRRLASC